MVFDNAIQSHYEGKPCVQTWNNYMWIQWQLGKLHVLQSCHRHWGPDSAGEKSVILSHADWFWFFWMTALTSSGVSSCLCSLSLVSDLHPKRSSMLTLASPWSPGRGFLVICMQRSHLTPPCSNWLTNINRKLLSIGTTLYTDLLQISAVTLS